MSLRSASRPRLRYTAAGCCCAALAVFGGSTGLAGPVAESLSTEVRQVFTQAKGAVVRVEASDKTGQLCGTGFFIDPNGTLLTGYSVGGESNALTVVLPGNTRVTARCMIADARAGIAILKAENVPSGTPFLPLSHGGQLALATPVVTVAYPMDMPVTPSFGLVSGLDLKYLGRYFATTHIRASVPVQRGQGGAPLLNMQGEVVGVVISSIDNGSACFAIPMEAVEKIRRDYDRYGVVKPGWLGVAVRAVATGTADGPASSAEVERLEADAPALRAGLQPGDRLLQIGQTGIHSPEDVLNASFFLTAGEKIPIVVWRDGHELTLEAKPEERTSSDSHVQGFQKIPTASATQGDITLRLR